MARRSLHRVICASAFLALTSCSDAHGRLDDAGPAAGPDAARPDRVVAGWDVYDADYAAPGPQGLGQDPDLAIDRAGTFHIAHVYQDTGEVLYTHGVPGHFTTEHVGREEASPTETSAVSLALGPDGTVHIAYGHDAMLGATHATRRLDGTWSLHALPFEVGPRAAQPAVTTFADGTLLFVGTGVTTRPDLCEIRVAVGDAAPVLVGQGDDWPSLRVGAVVTSDGVAHAIFNRYLGGMTDWRVTVATRDASGTWRARDRSGAVTGGLAAGPDGSLHLALVRQSGDQFELVHTRGASDDASSGEETLVATQRLLIQQVSIVVAPSGAVHIAYEVPGEEHYATNASGIWTDATLEVVYPNNGRPAIALDAEGAPWIVYRDADSRLVVVTLHRGS